MEHDLEAFRLHGSHHPQPQPKLPAKPKRKQTEPFVKGPIPLGWLQRAAKLPGKAPLLTALTLFYLAGLKRTRRGIRLSAKQLGKFGVGRRNSYDALSALETAGLVSVKRKVGRLPIVDILSE